MIIYHKKDDFGKFLDFEERLMLHKHGCKGGNIYESS